MSCTMQPYPVVLLGLGSRKALQVIHLLAIHHKEAGLLYVLDDLIKALLPHLVLPDLVAELLSIPGSLAWILCEPLID